MSSSNDALNPPPGLPKVSAPPETPIFPLSRRASLAAETASSSTNSMAPNACEVFLTQVFSFLKLLTAPVSGKDQAAFAFQVMVESARIVNLEDVVHLPAD